MVKRRTKSNSENKFWLSAQSSAGCLCHHQLLTSAVTPQRGGPGRTHDGYTGEEGSHTEKQMKHSKGEHGSSPITRAASVSSSQDEEEPRYHLPAKTPCTAPRSSIPPGTPPARSSPHLPEAMVVSKLLEEESPWKMMIKTHLDQGQRDLQHWCWRQTLYTHLSSKAESLCGPPVPSSPSVLRAPIPNRIH